MATIETLVSVIIPCYKDSQTLARAINSVQKQAYSNLEIIVINDCSPESKKIEDVLRSYPQIRYIKNTSNLGLAATRNIGANEARGSLISFLDSDDEWHPQKLEFQIKYWQKSVAVSCSVMVVKSESEKIHTYFRNKFAVRKIKSPNRLFFKNYLTGASILISKEDFLCVGGYDEKLRSCEDYDLWLRLILSGYLVFNISLPLYYYYYNNDGLSKNIPSICYWELEVIKKLFLRDDLSRLAYKLKPYIFSIWLFRHLYRSAITQNIELKNKTILNARLLIEAPILLIILELVAKIKIPFQLLLK